MPAVPRSARFYAWLSIAAAVFTIGLKLTAWKVTGSVGMLSDAAESVVNLVAALIALWALTVAERPPDARHAFGYTKAEYFSSGVEGFLIIGAAAGIVVAAWERWRNPQPIQDAWLGVGVSLAASAAQRLGRRRAPVGRAAPALDHAHGRRAPPADRRVDLGRRHSRNRPRRAHRVAAAGSADRRRRGGQHRLDRLEARSRDRARPARFGASGRRAPRGNRSARALSGRGHPLSRHPLARRRAAPLRHDARPRARELDGAEGPRSLRADRGRRRRALPGAHAITHLEPREDPVSWEDRGLDRK